MQNFGVYVIPVALFLIISIAIFKKVKIFDTFLGGASEGINSAFSIAPSLIGLITAVYMIRASGALELFTNLMAPLVKNLGIPPEVLPLALLRPISGSGSVALLDGILTSHGAESFIGKVASVLMGSTETTFYVLAVYFGAVKIKNSRHVVPCALLADFTALIIAVLTVRLLL